MVNYKKNYTYQPSTTATEPAYPKDYNFYQNYEYAYDPCVNCPNNSANGGSGVCNCALPDMYNKHYRTSPEHFYNTLTTTDLKFITLNKEKSISILSKNGVKKIIKVPCHVVKEETAND